MPWPFELQSNGKMYNVQVHTEWIKMEIDDVLLDGIALFSYQNGNCNLVKLYMCVEINVPYAYIRSIRMCVQSTQSKVITK